MFHYVYNLTKNFVSMFDVLLLCWHYFESAFIVLLTLVYMHIILQCHGDIEPNPGPRKLKTYKFSVCHWNLNSLSANSFSKPTQLKAYNSIYKCDFICLSITCLDSSIPDNLIDIERYKLLCADHPDSTKRGGVCIYHKQSLPVRVISLTYFKEALLLPMKNNNKKSDGFCYLLFA